MYFQKVIAQTNIKKLAPSEEHIVGADAVMEGPATKDIVITYSRWCHRNTKQLGAESVADRSWARAFSIHSPGITPWFYPFHTATWYQTWG